MATEAGRFVFGVDLDGVVADFYGKMREIVAEWLGEEPGTLTDDFRFGLTAWGVRGDRHYKQIHRFAVTQRGLFETVEVIPGAGPTLRRLSDEGVSIRIISHRLFIAHFHQEAVRQTVKWLDHHAIPYWDLCFLKHKAEVGADLYIEDSPENIATLGAMSRPVIVFTNPTNKHLDAPLRADTWEQVGEIVMERVSLSGKELKPPDDEQGPANAPSGGD